MEPKNTKSNVPTTKGAGWNNPICAPIVYDTVLRTSISKYIGTGRTVSLLLPRNSSFHLFAD